jgi:hypothetical protein
MQRSICERQLELSLGRTYKSNLWDLFESFATVSAHSSLAQKVPPYPAARIEVG